MQQKKMQINYNSRKPKKGFKPFWTALRQLVRSRELSKRIEASFR